ncbi:MAG: hypothetical protein IPI63_09285 [Methanothrix sp.]|jgi:hypothetical protein|uniref:hypothetical protein n=1 Tax=Methanothrix sp. TaxID=90426 RepID=UPI0025F379FA|nr:hypothetical protein [Methanothrix sp.]MBK7386891.1 hypothetical protein [Methanothrix sp.]
MASINDTANREARAKLGILIINFLKGIHAAIDTETELFLMNTPQLAAGMVRKPS